MVWSETLTVAKSLDLPDHQMILQEADSLQEFRFQCICACGFVTGFGRSSREAMMWATQHLEEMAQIKGVAQRRAYVENLAFLRKRRDDIVARFTEM